MVHTTSSEPQSDDNEFLVPCLPITIIHDNNDTQARNSGTPLSTTKLEARKVPWAVGDDGLL